MPEGWRQTLPSADHQWVSRQFFNVSASTGKVEFDSTKVTKLWWYPPQPPPICNQLPKVSRYFSQPLLMWMPRKLWRLRLVCPQPGCKDHELTSCGVYPHVRQVLGVAGYYSLASEYLECSACKRKVISWSEAVLKQLDVGRRQQFPALLTYR